MWFVVVVAVSVGIAGALGMTWAFPLIGLLRTGKSTEQLQTEIQATSLHIIIPAHNEQSTLGGTIKSIQKSINLVQEVQPDFEAIVTVVCNRCTDNTASKAAEHQGVGVVNFDESQGKWPTLGYAIKNSTSDWIGLVDAGITWDELTLKRLVHQFSDGSVMGIAPTYRNRKAGIIEYLSWKVEAHFKSIESLTGGPVSVHGATVFYRRPQLQGALEVLDGRSWLNDDVVIPLALRSTFPDQKIVYRPDIKVLDDSFQSAQNEAGRRQRMVKGNLDWVLTSFWRATPGLGRILAFRRIFRIFWAFWVLCLASPLLLFGWTGLFSFICLVAVCTQHGAFRSSLKSPVLLLSQRSVAWK